VTFFLAFSTLKTRSTRWHRKQRLVAGTHSIVHGTFRRRGFRVLLDFSAAIFTGTLSYFCCWEYHLGSLYERPAIWGVRNGAMLGEAHDFSPVRVGRIRNHTPARTWDELAWTFRYSTDSNGSLQLFLLRWWFYGIIPLKQTLILQTGVLQLLLEKRADLHQPSTRPPFCHFFPLQNHLLWFSFFFSCPILFNLSICSI